MEALAPVAAVSAPAPIGAAAVPAAPITEGIPLKQEEVHSAAAAAIEASKKAAHKKPASKADDLIIPKGSVKRVIKIDKDVRLVAADAVLVITKATVSNEGLLITRLIFSIARSFSSRSWECLHLKGHRRTTERWSSMKTLPLPVRQMKTLSSWTVRSSGI
jgi:hypothetical protein